MARFSPAGDERGAPTQWRNVDDTREVNPGEVWEENEFWLELTWRIDHDGKLRNSPVRRIEKEPRHASRASTSITNGFSTTPFPGLPEKAAAENLTPLEFMRRYGAFEVKKKDRNDLRRDRAAEELDDVQRRSFRPRLYARGETCVAKHRSGSQSRRRRRRPSSRRRQRRWKYQTRLSHAERQARVLFLERWAIGDGPSCSIPTYFKSHVHPDNLEEDQTILISTFRLPVQIHTRSANAKWLNEIAHTNPLWIHPQHAAKLGVRTGDLVRVETEIGYYVVRAWVTEGIRPGIVACSHHMGRWKLTTKVSDS